MVNKSCAHRLTLRQLALAAALLYFVLIGGTTLGTFDPAFAGINAAIATGLVGLWVIEFPRKNDLTDRLLLIALLAFLITCVMSVLPRMSFDAAMSVIAALAAFGIARGELASMRAERVMITVLALCGLVLSMGFLALWIPYWIAWWRGTGTAPPLDLPLPPGHYWHFHFAAMVLALLLPAALQLQARQGARAIAAIASLGAVGVIAMSGARTAWVGVSAVAIAAVLLRARLRPTMLRWAGAVIGGILIVLWLTGGLAVVASRLLNTFTVAIRTETWSSAFALWLERPLTGWGPGSFPAVFRFTQQLPAFPEPGTDAQNLVVQVLLESGLLGLIALLVAGAALAIGIRRHTQRSHYAVAGLAIVALMSLTDLPSSFPVLFVIGIAWAALSAPRQSAPIEPSISRRSPVPRVLAAVAGVGIIAAITASLLARGAFDEARHRIDQGDLTGARLSLRVAVAMDPSMALYWREGGVRAEEAGDSRQARSWLERAHQLNPSDPTTLRALAVLAVHDGRLEDGTSLARDAQELRPADLENNLLVAWVATKAGEHKLVAEALSDALTWSPWAAAAPTWADEFGPVSTSVLRQAAERWQAGPADRRRSWEATWLNAMTGGEPLAGLTPALAAVDAVVRCDLTRAADLLAHADDAVDDRAWLAARLMLSRLAGDEEGYRAAVEIAVLRRSEVALPARTDPGPRTLFADFDEDVGLYRVLPLDPAELEPLLPSRAEGLAAWLQDPRQAARIGAPESGLARCGGPQ